MGINKVLYSDYRKIFNLKYVCIAKIITLRDTMYGKLVGLMPFICKGFKRTIIKYV